LICRYPIWLYIDSNYNLKLLHKDAEIRNRAAIIKSPPNADYILVTQNNNNCNSLSKERDPYLIKEYIVILEICGHFEYFYDDRQPVDILQEDQISNDFMLM